MLKTNQWLPRCAWVLLLVMVIGCAGCSCNDDDDDDNDNDDNNNDDNNDVTDDDVTDDDVTDDDSTDDDASDDDSTADDDDDDDLPLNCDDVVCQDPNTGLVWQRQSVCCYDWDEARDYCQNLSLDGHTDWRLPAISELRGLVRGCPGSETGGACGVTDQCLERMSCWNDACCECPIDGGPAGGCYRPQELTGDCDWLWSSSPTTDVDNLAFGIYFFSGCVSGNVMRDDYYSYGIEGSVRCVR